jgi:hypothetical protein
MKDDIYIYPQSLAWYLICFIIIVCLGIVRRNAHLIFVLVVHEAIRVLYTLTDWWRQSHDFCIHNRLAGNVMHAKRSSCTMTRKNLMIARSVHLIFASCVWKVRFHTSSMNYYSRYYSKVTIDEIWIKLHDWTSSYGIRITRLSSIFFRNDRSSAKTFCGSTECHSYHYDGYGW